MQDEDFVMLKGQQAGQADSRPGARALRQMFQLPGHMMHLWYFAKYAT
jgi:hypothetical protein